MIKSSPAIETKPVHSSYYYLWHLAALNILQADFGPAPTEVPDNDQSAIVENPCPDILSTTWDRIAEAADGAIMPAKVFMIDVGVSRHHPNLKSRIDNDLSLDLTTHPYGAQSIAFDDSDDGSEPEGEKAFFTGLDIAGLGSLGLSVDDTDFLQTIVQEYANSKGVLRKLDDTDESFGTHGTAIAGLVCAEPAALSDDESSPTVDPDDLFGQDGSAVVANDNSNILPYFGADPFSRLVSIRTSFEPDACQFIAAFLYAWHHGAEVIVMPRGLPDPQRSRIEPKEELKADLELWENRENADLFERIAYGEGFTGEVDPKSIQPTAQPDRLWRILEKLIIAVSKKVPIVCAAGNDGESQLIYPASLADAENGIVAVGAVSAEGFRAGYSNYGDGLTLVAPSDDAEVFNRHQLRIDWLDPSVGNHHYAVPNGNIYAYSHFELMTTDLPGAFGYDEGKNPWSSLTSPHTNPGVGGGYYTSFGGTSGACALIGGVMALLQRAEKARVGNANQSMDGVTAKTILVQSCDRNVPVKPGYRPLTADTMNHSAEDGNSAAYFFGAGLPDADAAVEAILSGN